MKENDGRAARRKTTHRLIVLGSGALGCLVLLGVTGRFLSPLMRGGAAARHSSHGLRDPQGGDQDAAAAAATAAAPPASAHAFRRALHNQFGLGNLLGKNKKKDQAQVMKEVLAADLQLVDLTVVEEELLRSPSNSYAGVYGKFCKLDWSLRKRDPSAGTL